MSQRMRRNGSPVPTSPNTSPQSPGGSTVGLPPSTGGAPVGTGPGVTSYSRLGPMKATVPFQLRHHHHHHQMVLMQSHRSLHGGGSNNNNNNNNSNATNNNGKFHEASSSCAPGERGGGGGARTPVAAAATSHSRSPAPAADSVLLSFPSSVAPLSSPLDHASNVAPLDSSGFPSGTPSSSSLPSNAPSPIGNIPPLSPSSSSSSSSSSCLGANSSSSLPFVIPQVPQSPLPPPLPSSPTLQQLATCPPSPTPNSNSSMIPRGHGPLCSSLAILSLYQIDVSEQVVTDTSQSLQALSCSSSSTSVTSSPSAPLSSSSSSSPSSTVQCSRLGPHTSQSCSPDQDGRIQAAAAERSSPSSPAGERTRLALPFSSSSIRRTSSLDALTGPYLAGHWPKDAGHAPSCAPCMKDKATQTPSEWVEEWREEEEEERRSNHHKRSASWGSSDQLKEIAKLRQQLQRSKHSNRYHRDKDRKSPFNGHHTATHQPQVPVPRCVLLSLPLVSKATPVSRLRNSVEGLNQEIERITITHCKPQEDIPDGRRAPPPLLVLQSQSMVASPLHQSQTGMVSRTVDTQTTSSPSNSAPPGNHSSGSRAQSVSPYFLPAAEEGEERDKRGEEEEENLLAEGREKDHNPGSPLLKFSCSPKPNNSYMFQREPPEGCERVKVFAEDSHSRGPQHAVSPVFQGGPDRNKVNFVPNDRGSAFSILRKPLHS